MLPVIDHRGVWLPIAKLVETLRRYRPVRFVIADASQALGHLPLDGITGWCDFLLAGCHKWLGGYHPLGVAVTRDESGKSIGSQMIKEPCAGRVADDPLRRFVLELECGTSIRHGETAPVIPLLSACGAITDAMNQGIEKNLAARHANRCWLYDALHAIGWRPIRPALDPASGILLARAPTGSDESRKRMPTREDFVAHGVALTVDRQGLVRFSLPCRPIPRHHRVQVLTACQVIGRRVAA